MKYRNLEHIIRDRLAEKEPLIQVVIGPRQVGKTTALKAALSGGGVYENADYPTPLPFTVIEKWWNEALRDPSRILAIDEVQKIPGWSEILKKLWDASDRVLKVVVTGSSSLLVEKGLRETMSGRFELIRAEHWNYQEATSIFDLPLDRYLEFGCYPGSIRILDKGLERWAEFVRDAIVEPAIGRDLLQLHPVDQPALLRQIFGVAVSLPCQIISLQKMQGQLQGKGTLPTIQNYLSLLADAYLITGIEKYSKVPFRRRKSSPKLIIHDNGLIRAFERPIDQPLSESRLGRYFKNAVGARLLEAGWDLFYWKDRDVEVDFVAHGRNDEHLAIEVKSSHVADKELSGLRKFCEAHPEFEPCLVSLTRQEFPGIRTIAPEEILSFARRY